MTVQSTKQRAAVRTAPGQTKTKTSRTAGTLISQLVVVAGFILIWHLFAQTATASRAELPSPLEVAQKFVEFLGTAEFWSSLGSTVSSWVIAMILSVVIGIPIGLIIGRNTRLFDSTKWVIDFLRTIPSVALVPLALLLLGRSQSMVIIVAVIPAVWPLIIQAIYAGQQADPTLARVARSLRLTLGDRIRYVLAPDALAFIWPGIRLATTASLLVTIFAELLGGASGIGSQIMDAQTFNRATNLYAWVLTACILGLAINGVLSVVQRKLLWWHPSMRERMK